MAGEKFQEQYGLEIDVDCEPLQTSLDSIEKTLLFRVVRELLTNVIKHARAQHVKISLKENGNELKLMVADDDIGLEVSNHAAAEGFGLFSIAERLGNLGGQLNIAFAPGQGAQISVTLPLR
jgi:signal transduction histidine kinase